MPYISRREKELLDGGTAPQTCGHLTYLIYRAALDNNSLDLDEPVQAAVDRFLPEEPRFEDFAHVLGAVYAAALELTRRHPRGPLGTTAPYGLYTFASKFYSEVVGPYEDKKIEENGDVT